MSNYTNFDVVDDYKNNFSVKLKENLTKYLEKVTKVSNIDLEENKKSVDEIKGVEKLRNEIRNKINKLKIKKTISLTFIIISSIIILVSCYFIFKMSNNINSYIAIPISLIILSLFLIVFLSINIKKKINKELENYTREEKKLNSKIDDFISVAKNKLAPFVREFDNNAVNNIIHDTLPIINFDKNFNQEKFELLNKKFNFSSLTSSPDKSSVYVQSGDVNGNPFVLQKLLNFEMGQKEYVGTRLVTWQESYIDSEGKMRYRTRQEQLVARIYKPYPEYDYNYVMFFGNDASPNLNFIRYPSNITESKNLDKKIKKEFSKLEKRQKKATANGGTYTTLDNQEFEVLFNAKNRDNEQQFRLMFTALAQTQMVKLIKDNTTCGDRFVYEKIKKSNFIFPYFINTNFDFFVDYNEYLNDYNYEEIIDKISYKINTIFFNLYFTLAPLFCIPAYMQNKPEKFNPLFEKNYQKYCYIQHEELVNKLRYTPNINPKSVTENILKVDYVEQLEGKEYIKATAKGFYTEERIEYIDVLCQNGKYYKVPVKWYEYLPITNSFKCELEDTKKVKLGEINEALDKNKNSYMHNLICRILEN